MGGGGGTESSWLRPAVVCGFSMDIQTKPHSIPSLFSIIFHPAREGETGTSLNLRLEPPRPRGSGSGLLGLRHEEITRPPIEARRRFTF